jgi:hypothetical protein
MAYEKTNLVTKTKKAVYIKKNVLYTRSKKTKKSKGYKMQRIGKGVHLYQCGVEGKSGKCTMKASLVLKGKSKQWCAGKSKSNCSKKKCKWSKGPKNHKMGCHVKK